MVFHENASIVIIFAFHNCSYTKVLERIVFHENTSLLFNLSLFITVHKASLGVEKLYIIFSKINDIFFFFQFYLICSYYKQLVTRIISEDQSCQYN